MNPLRVLRRGLRRVLGRPANPAHLPGARHQFVVDEVDLVRNTYFGHGGSVVGAAWAPWLHAHMELPSWFKKGLDPFSTAYAEQQERLWQAVAGVAEPYVAALHEKEHSWGDVDPVRQPGFYLRRDADAVFSASHHFIASGMLLRHSGLKPGDRALEYGAGFGHTALALARLGVAVDTVDISATFCDYVRQQAEFFQVPLTPFHGHFGMHPRPAERYQLVWFYESFHHCVDFLNVVPKLADLLAPGGRVVLAGEPIVEAENAAVPYPWGLRLHSEVVAVVRQQGWFELGFSERFLYELFARSGFKGHRLDCPTSLFGRLYVFERAAP